MSTKADNRISIHVPREGHDSRRSRGSRNNRRFQSTCPARGTTELQRALFQRFHDFNPRAPRGARLTIKLYQFAKRTFQSTCPARGTTPQQNHKYFAKIISIHVPREGHDVSMSATLTISPNFNPRAPRGARLTTRHQSQTAR